MLRLSILIVLLSCLAACAPNNYYRARQLMAEGRQEEALASLREDIQRHPDSAVAWREAGVVYYNLGQYAQADSALTAAARLAPDLRTTLYRGLVSEATGDTDAAMTAYRKVLTMRPSGSVRQLAHAHYEALLRNQAARLARAARDAEATGQFTTPPANTIAVVAFDTADLPAELAPMGKGLANFLALDLGKVHALKVLERLEIDRITDELKLMQSGLVDPATRVRAGHLLGSRRLVTGTVQVPSSGQLELYGALSDARADASRDLDPVAGQLTRFFRLEKDLAFAIIADLGITLTPEERSAIELVPTENFAAFLAYSRGVTYRDEGRYREAAVEFQKAHHADGGFTEASDMAALTEDVATASGGDDAASDAGLAADGARGRFFQVLQGESGVMPVSLATDGAGSPTTTPPHTGAVTGVRLVIGGDY